MRNWLQVRHVYVHVVTARAIEKVEIIFCYIMITKHIPVHIVYYIIRFAKQVAVASFSLLFVTTFPCIVIDVGHWRHCGHRDVGVNNSKSWREVVGTRGRRI